MPGTGLDGGSARIREEVHVGASDTRGIGRQDDGTIHLGQLGQTLGRVFGVEKKTAGADRQDVWPVADNDERAGFRPENTIQPIAQRLTGRNEANRALQERR